MFPEVVMKTVARRRGPAGCQQRG